MSDEPPQHPTPGVMGRAAHLHQFDTTAPWAPGPAAAGPFEATPVLGVAAVPPAPADVVPAEVYEVRPPSRPVPRPPAGATAVMAEPPAYVARIPTSAPPAAQTLTSLTRPDSLASVTSLTAEGFVEPPVAALGLPPRPGRRRLRLAVTGVVVLCALGAIVVGYAALTRSDVTTQAEGPSLPGAPAPARSFPIGGPAGADPVPPSPTSASPSATVSASATAAATTAPATTEAATVAATSAAGAAATPDSSAVAALPPAAPPKPAGLLDATLTYRATSTDNGVAHYTGTIVLTNTQAADVTSWTVTLTVPGGNTVVVGRGAVAVAQSGESVVFTPSGGGVVPAGGSLTFSFGVRGILSDLPDGCAINGRSCS